jgi:hypothetical protein
MVSCHHVACALAGAVHSAESPHGSEPSEGGFLVSRVIQMATVDVEHDPETALHADVVAAPANIEEKQTCAQCGLSKKRSGFKDEEWLQSADGERKCIACHRANLDDGLRRTDASSRRAPRISGSAASGGARGRRKGRQQLMEKFEDKNPAMILVALVAIPFGIGLCAAYLWHGLIVVVPGYLYKYSGPFKWVFDPIRSFLNSIFFGSGKSDDDGEGFASLVGHLGGCVSGIGYFIVGMVLLVFYLKFILNTRFDRVRTYNEAVASWQEGLADEYASNWTSAGQLPTLRLEHTVDARDHASPLTYAPAFHLETNTTFEQSLPQLDTPGDMDKYEDKTMVAATIENFHVPTIRPSEGDGVLFVGIGDQNFTFATVRRYKDDTSHCDRYLNGLVFVFDEEVRRHECTPMYDNPTDMCYARWSSLHPPQNLTLRVEIRSPNDPVIVARDLFGCPSPHSSPMWDPSEKAAWRTVSILAYFVACSAVALFLFSKPGRWWFDDDDKIKKKNKNAADERDDDEEKVELADKPNRLRRHGSAGSTAASDAQPSRS